MKPSLGYFTARPLAPHGTFRSSAIGIGKVGDAMLEALREAGDAFEVSCREQMFRIRDSSGRETLLPGLEPAHAPGFHRSLLDSQRLAYLRVPRAAIFVHDLFAERSCRAGASALVRDLREYPRILTPSRYTAEMVCERAGIPWERLRITPLDCDRSVFRPLRHAPWSLRHSLGLPGNRPILLHVSYNYPRKNVAGIFRAFRAVLRDVPDALLVKLGRTRQDEILLRQHPELQDSVRFLERLPQERLAALYNAADCFVFPSLMEGFGLPVLEAQACGCPVVTSNTTALVEVAGPLCRTVNPFDIEGIARAIVQTLGDPERRARTADANAAWLTRFSWNPLKAAVREWVE